MNCQVPDCQRRAAGRGLCDPHYHSWRNDLVARGTSPLSTYINPLGYNHRTFNPLCSCTDPIRHYLPGFDDPKHPEHHGHYCRRCGKPPLAGLHPTAQAAFRTLYPQLCA
jgi:hypothetical protein